VTHAQWNPSLSAQRFETAPPVGPGLLGNLRSISRAYNTNVYANVRFSKFVEKVMTPISSNRLPRSPFGSIRADAFPPRAIEGSRTLRLPSFWRWPTHVRRRGPRRAGSHFVLDLAPGQSVWPVIDFTMKPRDGFMHESDVMSVPLLMFCSGAYHLPFSVSSD
jgi:hypothetical protein